MNLKQWEKVKNRIIKRYYSKILVNLDKKTEHKKHKSGKKQANDMTPKNKNITPRFKIEV